jgi:hypothetical protein
MPLYQGTGASLGPCVFPGDAALVKAIGMCRFSDHHAWSSRTCLPTSTMDETIAALSAEIEERIRPFERQLECDRRSPASAP